jgi:hypothetical protein
MHGSWTMLGAASLALAAFAPASAADLIVSAQDGKFVRVEGRATSPESPPPDSLVVVDASRFPPVVKATIESGLEHTVQGPPQAVAITPDGKLAIVAAPTRYDYAAKKELFDNFVQVVDLEASPPTVARVDVGAHTNGLTINSRRHAAPRRRARGHGQGADDRRQDRQACVAGQGRREAPIGDPVHPRRQVGDRRASRRERRGGARDRRQRRHAHQGAHRDRRQSVRDRRLERRQVGGDR